MGVNATDIITYIGIPLAVLGVLPILYTFSITILNQRRIRAALLRHGHKQLTSSKQQDGFTIRSSPMTTLIEVELPKFAIAPLERNNDQYWQLNSSTRASGRGEHDHLLERAESTLSTVEEGRVEGHLRGGSWRAFHWKRLIVGKKLYRIQYEDELREPPAEIDFPDLINFLLDWGAQLDPMGWEKLRSGGLWTPAGTVLLKVPHEDNDSSEMIKHHRDWVLRTVMPDESDGILTVCIRWPAASSYDVELSRGAKSLPPGWGRLEQPRATRTQDSLDHGNDGNDKKDNQEEKSKNINNDDNLASRIEILRQQHKQSIDSTSIRFKTESGLISQVYWEKDDIETGYVTQLTHLSTLPLSQSWFTSITSSLLLTKPTSPHSGSLWGLEMPGDISTFARKDTFPVGILVLLGILHNDKAPQWTTTTSSMTSSLQGINMAEQHRRRFQATLAAERLEATMPPEQARIARANREAQQREAQFADMRAAQTATREREQKRYMDASASSRMGNKAVAENCLEYLVAQKEIDPEWTIYDVVEAVLYLIVLDQGEENNERSEGFRVLKALDDWMTWANAGGLMRDQYHWLEGNKVAFCFAACLVAVVQEGALSTKGRGKASLDMLECLKMWRKVRLG